MRAEYERGEMSVEVGIIYYLKKKKRKNICLPPHFSSSHSAHTQIPGYPLPGIRRAKKQEVGWMDVWMEMLPKYVN